MSPPLADPAPLRAALTDLGWCLDGLTLQPTGDGDARHVEIRSSRGGFALGCVAGRGGLAVAEAEATERLLREACITAAILTDGAGPPRILRRLLSADRVEPQARLAPWTPPAPGQTLLCRSGAEGHSLRPLTRLESVLFEVHSHARDIDGLHAPEAVDELCKLLFLKVFDERTTPPGAPVRLQRAAYGSTEEYAVAARRLLLTAAQAHPTGHIWHRLQLSSAALTRCLDELAPYSLEDTGLDIKGRAFQSTLVPAARAGMGQYFTPEAVGALMVAALSPRPDERVLDPFCGSAHFLSQIARVLSEQDPALDVAAYSASRLAGIEKSERMMRVAWTDLALSNLSGVALVCGDALDSTARSVAHTPGSFDVVITNPPFGSILRADACTRLGVYRTAAGRVSVPLEILAFERVIQLLRPGGRLGIVLPDGALGNQRAAAARRILGELLAIRAIVSLPVEAFAPLGANVKTSVLFARRLLPGERQPDEASIFLAQADSIGMDASGRPTSDGELPAITAALVAFLAEEGW